jgi:hypothetical protein
MKNAFVLLCGLACMVACVAQNDPRLKAVGDLTKKVEALESSYSSLQSDVWELQAASSPYKTATFDPGEPSGYGRVDTSGGTFLVSVVNVTPYLDGFRVTCHFGNPSTATFHGFKLHLKWGPRFNSADKKTNWLSWRAALREKDLSLADVLRPGAWNRVAFVVAPAKGDEFGHLEMSMDTSEISLVGGR